MTVTHNERPLYDREILDIARYVSETEVKSAEAFHTAALSLMDALGCAILALHFPECTKLLGPVVPDTVVPQGVPIPGTHFILDPAQAAFNIGTLIRWLDFNDTWLAAEWGHPSDNLGALLAVADYVSRTRIADGKPALLMRDLLISMIKAHEIQGIIALNNSFNRIGLDHVVLVKVASAALATHLLGGKQNDIAAAISQAWIDGQSLRTYRHSPNTGSRKSWAAGDATRRAVELAQITLKGEIGYPSALTAKTWGFYDVYFKGQPFSFSRPYESYVMENILFKASFPAEFHAQTAVEAALLLHSQIIHRINDITRITLTTQESAMRIINKTGPLHNPADRDHCLQYMVAIALLFGKLTADHYENEIASDPRIDALREKMVVIENKQFTLDYLDPSKRSIANGIQIHFKDGSSTDNIVIEYPLGHCRRRKESIPALIEKFKSHLSVHFSPQQTFTLVSLFQDPKALQQLPVHNFMDMWIPE